MTDNSNASAGLITGSPTRLPDWMFLENLKEDDLRVMADDVVYTASSIIIEKHGLPVDVPQKRFEAEALLESIRAMVNLDSKRQQFILWAMVQLEERNLLHYADESETVVEMARGIMNKEFEKNPKSSASWDWSFIVSELLPLTKSYGYSNLKILSMLTNDSKLRTAVPKLRFTLDHEPDSLIRQEKVNEIMEDIMNPELHAKAMREKYHEHRYPNEVAKISASAASFFLLDQNGAGLVTIRVDNQAQLEALTRSTKGLLEDGDSQFMPRDIRALAREMATVNKPIPVSTIIPLTMSEVIAKLDENKQFAGTVVMSLESIVMLNKDQIDRYITTQICSMDLPIVTYTLTGVTGNTMMITAVIDGSGLEV